MRDADKAVRLGRRAFLATGASTLLCGAAWGGAAAAAVGDDVWRRAREVVRSGRIGALVWGQAEIGADGSIEDAAARLAYAADAQVVRSALVVRDVAGPGADALATLDCAGGLTLVASAQRGHAGPLRLTLRGVHGVLRCEGRRMTVRLYREGSSARGVWPD